MAYTDPEQALKAAYRRVNFPSLRIREDDAKEDLRELLEASKATKAGEAGQPRKVYYRHYYAAGVFIKQRPEVAEQVEDIKLRLVSAADELIKFQAKEDASLGLEVPKRHEATLSVVEGESDKSDKPIALVH